MNLESEFRKFVRRLKGDLTFRAAAELAELASRMMTEQINQFYRTLNRQFDDRPDILKNLECVHEQLPDHLDWMKPELERIVNLSRDWEADAAIEVAIHRLADSFYAMVDELTDACGAQRSNHKVHRNRSDLNSTIRFTHRYLMRFAAQIPVQP